MRQYPTPGDYQGVLQHPRQAFTVPELQRAVIATYMGLPDLLPGSSAAVLRATIGAKDYALRCYLRDEASDQGRYAALSRFLAGTPALSTSVGSVKWHEGAIRANGGTWPVLQMEWIDGDLLGDYVGYLVDNDERQALGALAHQWLTLVGELQKAGFAHGDLQHGNIIVDRQQRLRLIDFDGVWCLPMQRLGPPTERGHDNFQPPGRTAADRWGPMMDTFSALVIYLALTALSVDTALWAPLNDGENLLFTSKDFSLPFNTKVWDLLGRLSDETVNRLARQLRGFCVTTGAGDKTLAAVVTRPWWEEQAKVPAPRPAQARPSLRPSSGTGPPPWYAQPLPATPAGGYQSPVARPARVPARPGRPTGTGFNWWEAATPATSRPRSGSSSARPAVASGRAPAARSFLTAAPAARRAPAKKARYPYRPGTMVLFIAGVVLLIVLVGLGLSL